MLFKWFSRLLHTIVFLILLVIFSHLFAPMLIASPISNAFINEIHYENSGGDTNEFVEIAGAAGINLKDWSLHFYNGSNGSVYKEFTFNNLTLDDTQNGFGLAGVKVSGIQNGAPDGIALVDNHDVLVQFLSYEGAFLAASGIAAGLLSTDINVFEPTNTPANFSLQLTGQGNKYSDFNWASPQQNTLGGINVNQKFLTKYAPTVSVNEPNSLFLLSFLCLILGKRKASI